MAPRTTLLVGGVVAVAVVGAFVVHLATTKASNPAHTFTAGADAYVSAAKAATNYGRASELSVDGSPVKRAYVRFVVAGVAGRPSRATLRVYATSPSRNGLAVSRVAEDGWAEQSLTWSNAPPISGAPTATSSRFSPGWVADRRHRPGGRRWRRQLRDHGAGPDRRQPAQPRGRRRVRAPTRRRVRCGRRRHERERNDRDRAGGVTARLDLVRRRAPGDRSGGRHRLQQRSAPPAHAASRASTASLIAADPKVAAVLPLGDIQYECGDYPNLQRFYDPTWGRFRAITHPAIGNHEYLTTRGASHAIPRRPSRGRATSTTGTASASATGPAGDRTQGYYSYDVGSWHLIALNSNCSRVGRVRRRPRRRAIWLRNDLAAHPSRCTLAYWHHPRFSSGEHGDNLATGPLWDALYAAGADIVLNGHDHDYERFAPQTPAGIANPASGIREFVVGTGGKSHYRFQTVQPNSEVRNADTFGILELTLRPQGYDWRFVPAQGGTFTDSGSGTCH